MDADPVCAFSPVLGARCPALGVDPVPGPRCQVPGTWNPVPGACLQKTRTRGLHRASCILHPYLNKAIVLGCRMRDPRLCPSFRTIYPYLKEPRGVKVRKGSAPRGGAVCRNRRDGVTRKSLESEIWKSQTFSKRSSRRGIALTPGVGCPIFDWASEETGLTPAGLVWDS